MIHSLLFDGYKYICEYFTYKDHNFFHIWPILSRGQNVRGGSEQHMIQAAHINKTPTRRNKQPLRREKIKKKNVKFDL